jgi:hypothetical protein
MGNISGMTYTNIILSFLPGTDKHFTGNTLQLWWFCHATQSHFAHLHGEQCLLQTTPKINSKEVKSGELFSTQWWGNCLERHTMWQEKWDVAPSSQKTLHNDMTMLCSPSLPGRNCHQSLLAKKKDWNYIIKVHHIQTFNQAHIQ